MDSPQESSLLPAVARFLEFEGHRSPDFSGCMVLVPHHHAGQAFRLGLRQSLPDPVLRPPRLLTLPELALQAGQNLTAEPQSKRLAELHDFLSKTGLLPEAGLWQATQELDALLEEMDAARASLDSPGARQALEGRGGNPHLGLEATISRTVWQAMAEGAPGRNRAQWLRLAWMARHADRPLYTLGLLGLAPSETAFLEAWKSRQAVVSLPTAPPHGARHDLLMHAWRMSDPPLAQRAAGFATAHGASPLAHALNIHAAHSLETGARAAEQILLDWLAAGHRRIALVALDRLLARRLRALLERRNILVQDETGWAFSTSAVSHVFERWLGMVSGSIWHRDLVDLLKSPFVFADIPDQRSQAVHELEFALRRRGAPNNLAGYQAMAHQAGLAHLRAVLERLATARSLFPQRRQTLGQWTRCLQESLEILGARQGLSSDPIGSQLLDMAHRLEDEVRGLPQRFSLGDWRHWLFLHLEQTTFADTSVESPIRLTHLAAAHHRDLDGVLVLGAGAAHLPGGGKVGMFNDGTLRQLGLPGRGEKDAIVQDMLMDVLCRTPRAAFIWQAETDGDPAPLSPWLTHLEAFHQAAWQETLVTPTSMPSWHGDGPATPTFPPPRAPSVPRRLSVSAWQSLVSCPYQFFVRHFLGLNQLDETPEEMDKAEYGNLVHRVLARFHTDHPTLGGQLAQHWEAVLTDLSAQVFADAEQRNFLTVAWRMRWERHIPQYVAWALGHEGSGWNFQSAETPIEKPVIWGEHMETVLYGRADRLDRKAGTHAVLDYKTQARQTLKSKLDASGEDVQLAAYAWLADATQAGFVTVDDKQVALLRAEQGEELAARALAEADRIAGTLQELDRGQPMPAHGAPGTCAWCEMEGLCRRAHRADTVP